MIWRTGVMLAFIVTAVVLAIQIGERLSDAAMQTIAGVLCGIGASIPVCIVLLLALTRERVKEPFEEEADYRSKIEIQNPQGYIIRRLPNGDLLISREQKQIAAPDPRGNRFSE